MIEQEISVNPGKAAIPSLKRLPWGTHLCQFYHSKDDLLDVLIPYFKAGLENNEACLWITSRSILVAEARNALGEKINNLQHFLKTGQLEILDHGQWYTRRGRFEPDLVMAGWLAKEREALDKGFSALRFTGETTWLENEGWLNFREYEVALNKTIGRHRIIAACAYSLDQCSASQIIEAVNNHQFALIKNEQGWVAVENSSSRMARDQLREISHKYELFVENAPLHVAAIDQAGKFFIWNRYSETLFGYRKEEVINKLGPEDLYDSSADLAKINRAIRRKNSFEGEVKLRRKNGSALIMHVVIIPYEDPAQNLLHFYGFGEDVTARKRAQNALERLNAQLEKRVAERTRQLEKTARSLRFTMYARNLAQEMTHNGTWQLETTENLYRWSDEAYHIFGREIGTPLDRNTIIGLAHRADRQKITAAWHNLMEGTPYDLEYRVCVGGKTKWLREKARLELDPQGSINRFIGVVQDITESKNQDFRYLELQTEMNHVSRLTTMGELAVTWAHEINQPLMAIMSNAQAARRLLASKTPDLEEIGEIFDDIIASDRWASDVIINFRNQLRKSDLKFERLDINDVVREVLSLLNVQIVRADISPKIRLDDEIPPVSGDRVHLRHVVMNLLLNSFEVMHSCRQKNLRIRTKLDNNGCVKVLVKDSGPGFDEKIAGELFKPFFSTKPENLGMGLAICKTIVEAHGGEIGAKNNACSGATFYFTLPIERRC